MFTHKGFLGKFWSASLFLVVFGVLVSPVLLNAKLTCAACKSYETRNLSTRDCSIEDTTCPSYDYGLISIQDVCVDVDSGASDCEIDPGIATTNSTISVGGCASDCLGNGRCGFTGVGNQIQATETTDCDIELIGECAASA